MVAAAAACLAGSALAGCGPTTCASAAGRSSSPGIWVDYSKVADAHPHQRLTATACVLGTCATHRLSHQYATDMYAGIQPHLTGSPIVLRVRITDADGEVAFRGSTTVRPQWEKPYAPGCGTAGWAAEAKATGDHTLRPVRLPR